ncbi:MAG: hypothetical protein HUU04_06355 [Verrucomicrobiae bacterium]|nr:hypothetical protein [Verrucomicrobiae bacterium]
MLRALFLTLGALGVFAARAAELPANPNREALTLEIRKIEVAIDRLNDRLLAIPSREIGLRQPLERELRDQQRQLIEKQRALAALPHAPGPNASQAAALRPVAKLFKEGKDAEGLARWKAWLKSANAPKDPSPADVRPFAAWVAGETARAEDARNALLQQLLEAAAKPTGE